jgi:hypothetical protein
MSKVTEATGKVDSMVSFFVLLMLSFLILTCEQLMVIIPYHKNMHKLPFHLIFFLYGLIYV